MKKMFGRGLMLATCLLMALVLAGPAMAATPTATYPCLFYGTASVDDEPVDAGTEITGWVGDEQVGSTATGEGDLDPNAYAMTVELEGEAEVSFKIGELEANETATWVKFGSVEVNLTATTAGGPTYPCLFYGTASVDDEPVAAGAEITAWVQGEEVASALTGEGDLADNEFSLAVELESATEVSFKIGELTANETATWVKFGSVEVNLTAATTGGPTYPCLFYGTASVDDEPVAAGAEITAWVGGEQVGSAITGEGDLADNQFPLVVELESAAEVSFKIGELTANETATWVKFGSVEVNLTANTAPAGGGGGVTRYYVDTNLFGIETSFRISKTGEVLKTIEATSEDGMLTFTIPDGTIALDKYGKRLKSLQAAIDESPPDPPEDSHIIGLAYDFGPDGATFDPPVTLEYTYDPGALPEGVAEEDLVLAYYDEEAGEWVELDCVGDTVNNTITASVEHFTTFAIIGAVTPPEEEEVVPPEEEEVVPPEEEEVVLPPEEEVVPPEEEEVVPAKPLVNWPVLGSIIGGVIVVALLVFFLVRRRRA